MFLYIIISLIILIFSAILHEIAHGLVADRLGDPTPRLSGRLTLDPRPHIDPLMSIGLPLLLVLSGSPIIFGGAKPVPIDPFNLRDGRKDVALVSLAGPLTNILLAIIAAITLKILPHTLNNLFFESIRTVLLIIVTNNLYLAIFNFLPIPPLDGSKVFALFLPEQEAQVYLRLGQFGMIILFFLLAFPIGGFSLEHIMYTLFIFSRTLLGI